MTAAAALRELHSYLKTVGAMSGELPTSGIAGWLCATRSAARDAHNLHKPLLARP